MFDSQDGWGETRIAKIYDSPDIPENERGQTRHHTVFSSPYKKFVKFQVALIMINQHFCNCH